MIIETKATRDTTGEVIVWNPGVNVELGYVGFKHNKSWVPTGAFFFHRRHMLLTHKQVLKVFPELIAMVKPERCVRVRIDLTAGMEIK